MITPTSQELAPVSSARHLELHARSDEDLDTLPFGVIALDRKGTILRYNLAESRFARLDRAQVIGRDFFREIAPCTATDGFQGHVDRFLGGDEPTFSFEYVFDFRFGAQLVDVELVRPPEPHVVYVCVNRRRLRPPRSEIASSQLAIEQRQLAPDEERLGVRRDPIARRRLDISPVVIGAAATAMRGIVDLDVDVVFERWGHAWGRRATIELQTQALERHDALLRELSMSRAVEIVAQHLQSEGWGRLGVDFEPARLGVFVLEIERSALAELPGRHGCAMMAGFLAAIFSHLAGRLVAVRELGCRRDGGSQCVFVAGAKSREALLRETIEAAGGSRDRWLAALEARLDAALPSREAP